MDDSATSAAQAGEDDERLSKALQEADFASAGRLQVLDLDRIKRHFGDNWPRIAAKAQAMIRQTVEKTLLRGDVFVEVGELAFVLIFPNLAKEQAQVKTAAISREIARKLIGDSNSDARFDFSAVVAAIPKGKTFDAANILGNLDALLDSEEALGATTEPAVLETTEANMTRAEQVEMELRRLITDVKFVFRPLWFVSKSALSTYLCLPVRDFGAQRRETGYRVIEIANERSLIMALDFIVLERCIAELKAMQQDGRQFLLSCPVHYETLAGVSSRTRFLEACARLPRSQQRFLLFHIVALPQRAPQGRVLEITGLLKPRARAVSIGMPLGETDFRSFVGSGVFAVGVDLNDWEGAERSLMKRMDGFVAGAHKSGLETFIHGLTSLSMTTAAIGSGFDYLHSDIILPDVDAPAHIHKFMSAELFRAFVTQE
ncbi:MAG: hypothetical protein WD767_07635 [Alphaproteobacteria bacterium]